MEFHYSLTFGAAARKDSAFQNISFLSHPKPHFFFPNGFLKIQGQLIRKYHTILSWKMLLIQRTRISKPWLIWKDTFLYLPQDKAVKLRFFKGFSSNLEKDPAYVSMFLSFQAYKNVDRQKFYQLIQKEIYNQLINRLNAVNCSKLDAIKVCLDSDNLVVPTEQCGSIISPGYTSWLLTANGEKSGVYKAKKVGIFNTYDALIPVHLSPSNACNFRQPPAGFINKG